ncbi:cytochrome c [Marinobacter lacisalsi]|uniref:Cytochrome c n=1 Tax=Marinobacter lacisalsi TaxID=475979 RepID=A0ABV8QI45_9GAMM
MTTRSGKLLTALLLGLSLSTSSLAAEPVTPKLTDKLSRLLQEEMRSVQAAMTTIHSAMVMGQHEDVAENAQQIHDSFILSQSMTDQDRKDLMSAVPEDFVKLDQEFHELAAALAEAGRTEDTDEQQKLFGEMTRNCIQCHSTYVSDRFPGVQAIKD